MENLHGHEDDPNRQHAQPGQSVLLSFPVRASLTAS
jgi:hypothetical protein